MEPEHEIILKTTAELAKDFSQRSPMVDKAGTYPSDNLRELSEKGYLEAFLPKPYGQDLGPSLFQSIGLLELPKVRVSPEDPGCFEIISGHRRVKAASDILGWMAIECEILECSDEFQAMQLCLEENIQRANLSPYEERNRILTHPKDVWTVPGTDC